MSIIDGYLPLKTKEDVDLLMARLQASPGNMTEKVFQEILQSINKFEVQKYFVEHYPEAMFTDKPSTAPAPALVKPAPATPASTPTGAQGAGTTYQIYPFPDNSTGSKKYIYGTYIEMAFHNLFLNMQHIYALTFGKDIMKKAEVSYYDSDTYLKNHEVWNQDFANEFFVWNPMFDGFSKAKPEEKEKADELLDKYFPFLTVFIDSVKSNPQFKELGKLEIIKQLSQVMRVLRNYYSHYELILHPNQEQDLDNYLPMIVDALGHIFLASKRVVKDRFAFDDRAMQCAEQYRFITDREKKDERGKPLKKKVEIETFAYQITKGNNGGRKLTPFGMVLLTSLFLEKKYAKIFADKLHVVKHGDEKVICEMLSVYRIRLKVQRLTVTKPADALALDIINELQRCPKELFELMTPEDQRSFRVKSEENDGGDEVLMIRHGDRFPQLVMKYIDDNNLFSDIRFQVSLGKYFFKFYNKQCIDGSPEPRVRALSKDIYGFGRLAEMEELRKAVWADILREYEDVHRNTTDEKPYITDHHASYVVNGKRIALHIFEDEARSFMPELTTEGARSLAPTCWMSTYELPAMMFLMHLTDSAHVEEVIKYSVAHYRRLFADIRDGKVQPFPDSAAAEAFLQEYYGGILLKDIPKTLQNFLCLDRETKGASLEARTKALVDDLIEQTKYKLDKLNSDLRMVRDCKQNKIGKKRYVEIKPGRMASFLAKDMMFFQPCTDDKLTGLNYRILQSVLATFSGDTDILKRTLEAAHILGQPGDPSCNPIVQRLWADTVKPADTVAFYKAYLKARLSFLNQCRREANWASLPFAHAGRTKWQVQDEDYCRAKAGRYLHDEYGGVEFDKAIELPRGLFDSYIREELEKISTMADLAGDASKNMSYLIHAYFLKVTNDNGQTFYNAKRCYPLMDKLYKRSPRDPHVFKTIDEVRKALLKENKESLQRDMERSLQKVRYADRDAEREHLHRLVNNMKENETILKRFKVQDMILFLMAKRILLSGKREGEDAVQKFAVEKIHLHDLKEGEALSQKIKMEMRVVSKNGHEKSIVKDEVKMKDYVRFYQILNDRRLPSLLNLIGCDEIPYDLLEQELCGYDKVHPGILETVFEYEKKYEEETGNPVQDKFSSMVFSDARFDDSQKKTITGIRNSFAHVSYPGYKAVREAAQAELPQKAETISDKFKKAIKKVNDN